MRDPVIEVEGLCKRYGDRVAVRDVSFTVSEHEIFGIVGANGAGKTTTVECLQALRRADAGSMRILGSDVATGTDALRTKVGSQLQDAALPDRLRVAEALRLFALDDGVDIAASMATWGLAEHARKPFASLSGGLRQRLFIALALVNRPTVVFFDELTQGLDPAARRGVWDVVRKVRDTGATIVLVTHFMDEAEQLCDRIAVFESGRIVACDTPDAIIRAHATTARVTFESLDARLIETLRGVARVDEVRYSAGHAEVIGAPEMVVDVCAALVGDAGARATVRVHQPSLEDAVVAIGAANLK